MKVTDFDFELPASLIALRPAVPRDNCRLLILHRDGSVEHRKFLHLPEYLDSGDLLLLNDTKVFPARLIGTKKTGGKLEFLLVKEIGAGKWEILCRENYTGSILVAEELCGEMLNGKSITFEDNTGEASLMSLLWKRGLMPLPPYIKRKPDGADMEHYQTVYAEKIGSIAAPTAGLHFTEELMTEIEEKGVITGFLTLHVGTGTFKPIRVESVEDHAMQEERFEIEESLIEKINSVKESGKRVISVGTTSTRAIEGFFSGRCIIDGLDCNHFSAGDNPPQSPSGNHNSPYPPLISRGGDEGGGVNLRGDKRGVKKICGSTDIFIHPGYRFRVVDSLVTNFHLPRSTPLMLTSAFADGENLINAYRQALSMEYRFFSYGDAMLIL